MSEDNPAVFVVVLSYNCSDQVRRCLASFSQVNYDNFSIVMVDNDSSDNVASIVQASFGEMQFIQTGENRGYAGGNNQGIKYALARGASYILILNPDTVVVNPDFLREL